MPFIPTVFVLSSIHCSHSPAPPGCSGQAEQRHATHDPAARRANEFSLKLQWVPWIRRGANQRQENGRVIPSIMGCEHGEWKQWFDGDAPMSTSALPAGQLEQSRAPASDQVCRFLCLVHFVEVLYVGKVKNDVLLSKTVRP